MIEHRRFVSRYILKYLPLSRATIKRKRKYTRRLAYENKILSTAVKTTKKKKTIYKINTRTKTRDHYFLEKYYKLDFDRTIELPFTVSTPKGPSSASPNVHSWPSIRTRCSPWNDGNDANFDACPSYDSFLNYCCVFQWYRMYDGCIHCRCQNYCPADPGTACRWKFARRPSAHSTPVACTCPRYKDGRSVANTCPSILHLLACTPERRPGSAVRNTQHCTASRTCTCRSPCETCPCCFCSGWNSDGEVQAPARSRTDSPRP